MSSESQPEEQPLESSPQLDTLRFKCQALEQIKEELAKKVVIVTKECNEYKDALQKEEDKGSRLEVDLITANDEIQKLKAEITNLNTKLSEAQSTNSRLTASFEEAKKSAEDIKADFESLKFDLMESVNHLEDAHIQIEDYEGQLAASQEKVKSYEKQLALCQAEVSFYSTRFEENDHKIAALQVELSRANTGLAQFNNENQKLGRFNTELVNFFTKIDFVMTCDGNSFKFRIQDLNRLFNEAMTFGRGPSFQQGVDTWTIPKIEMKVHMSTELTTPRQMTSSMPTMLALMPAPDTTDSLTVDMIYTKIEDPSEIDTEDEDFLEIDTEDENSLEIDTEVEDFPTSLFASFAKWALVVSVLVFCWSIGWPSSGTSFNTTPFSGTSFEGTSFNGTLPEDPDLFQVPEDCVSQFKVFHDPNNECQVCEWNVHHADERQLVRGFVTYVGNGVLAFAQYPVQTTGNFIGDVITFAITR